MAQINMDINKNKNATAPVLEFMLPASEVDANLSTGQAGELLIPVVCVSNSDGMLTFRKNGPVKASGDFKEETTKQMRERLLADQADE